MSTEPQNFEIDAFEDNAGTGYGCVSLSYRYQ